MHFSKRPLLIEVENWYGFIAGIFLLIVSTYFLIIIPAKKYYGKDFENYLREESLKIGFDISSTIKVANVVFMLLFIGALGLFIWCFDFYVVANDNGIYYDPIETFGQAHFHSWDEINQIIYRRSSNIDGTAYKFQDPYYELHMNGGEILFLEGKEIEEIRWAIILKSKTDLNIDEI